MSHTIPQSLQQAFEQNRLIPVVGAGVSMSIKDIKGESIFPSWPGLLRMCAERLKAENKDKFANAVVANLDIGKYKEAANIAKEGLTGRLWGSFFRDVFSISKKDVAAASLELAQAIWTISDRIVTLNYDKVLRMAAKSPESVLELDNSCKAELADFCRAGLECAAIWHLHGKFDNASNIVFATESYDKLYQGDNENYLAALEAFRTLARNSTLIFIGCGLDDADILDQISREHRLFEGNSGPHFALVHSEIRDTIKTKLGELPIELLSFEDFGQPLINKILEIVDTRKAALLPPEIFLPPPKIEDTTFSPKIWVLKASPITRRRDFSDELRELKKLKCEVGHAALTLRSLNELGDCDYIVLLTSFVKKKLVVEDEALGEQYLTLKQIEENIEFTPKGILVFSDQENGLDLAATIDSEAISTSCVIFPKLNKIQLESLIFKVFKKKNLRAISNSLLINENQFIFSEFNKDHVEIRRRVALPPNIDAKTTANYVGRATDLENIARKIGELRDHNLILTIKGSGGLGKTLTVKKLAVEFAVRNRFTDGIHFIDCESISDFRNLEYKIANAFDLENTIGFREKIADLPVKRDALVILDNLESLLYLSERDEIIDLLSFVCDFTNLITTSRELLNIECETVYELRPFTTDEAFDLFLSEYRGKTIELADRRFIREEILEKLLDNNPLAIKLITRNIPSNKNLYELRSELEDDIFQSITENDLNAFDNIHDVNIERKKSLYASINFSYQYLEENEKRAFELLSLFPDGIHLQHFKLISSADSITKHGKPSARKLYRSGDTLITDKVIRTLENKSVIQVNNNMVKLQSIVGRFAAQKLGSRGEKELEQYYKNAFRFNYSLLDVLAVKSGIDSHTASTIFNSLQANFVRTLDYAHYVVGDSFELVDYIDSLCLMFIQVCSADNFLHALDRRPQFEFTEKKMELCLKLAVLTARYYRGEFATSFEKFQSLVDLEQLQALRSDDDCDWLIAASAIELYTIEGHALAAGRAAAKVGVTPKGYPPALFQIGELNRKLAATSEIEFFTLEALNALGMLTHKTLDNYISSLYAKSHLERTQTMYLKAKIALVPKQAIRKLITINPYTEGLKILMFAFVETNFIKKEELFEAALSQLKHVKYYYVECLYFYAQFLRDIGQEERLIEIKGLAQELAERHSYRYLLHLIGGLGESKETDYSPESGLIEGFDVSAYVSFILKQRIKS